MFCMRLYLIADLCIVDDKGSVVDHTTNDNPYLAQDISSGNGVFIDENDDLIVE